MKTLELLVTCEHGGNRVPLRYRPLFRGKSRLLESHRGYDPGALDLARFLARRFRCRLQASTVTRLLVELNRSVGHPALFSEVTRSLDPETRHQILRDVYYPHRHRVEAHVAARVSRGKIVLHLASHSFSPTLGGERRKVDVAWLYDPRRGQEKRFCALWKNALGHARSDLRLRRNYPYRGAADGLTTHLRTLFPSSRYLGIEIELNQRWYRSSRREWAGIRRAVAESLASVLDYASSPESGWKR